MVGAVARQMKDRNVFLYETISRYDDWMAWFLFSPI